MRRLAITCFALTALACARNGAPTGPADGPFDAASEPVPADIQTDPCQVAGAVIVQLAHATDGSRVAIAHDQGRVAVVALSGGLVRTLEVAPPGAKLRVALTEDGSVLAVAARGTVKLWRVADGRLLHELPVGTGDPVSLKFSDSPTPLLLAGFDRQANPADNVRVWRAADGILVGLVTGSPHATFTYADEAILLVDEAAGEYQVLSLGGTLRRRAPFPMPLSQTAFAADGAYLGGITGGGGGDERLAIMSVADDQFVWRSMEPTRGTRALLFLENPSRILQLGERALLYDHTDGRVLLPLPALASVATAVVSPDGARVLAASGGGLILVSMADGAVTTPAFCSR